MLHYAKAITAALVAGLGALGTALIDNAVAPVEWVGIVLAALVALAGVWAVPNRPATGEHRYTEDAERLAVNERRRRNRPPREDLKNQLRTRRPGDD
jgi:hypothetical protein